jgi:hypothetical protein
MERSCILSALNALLRKFRSFHGGDYEECCILWCYPVCLVRIDVSEDRSALKIRVIRIDELGKTLAVSSNRARCEEIQFHYVALAKFCERVLKECAVSFRRSLSEPHVTGWPPASDLFLYHAVSIKMLGPQAQGNLSFCYCCCCWLWSVFYVLVHLRSNSSSIYCLALYAICFVDNCYHASKDMTWGLDP